jgi:hypothetical protein
MTARYPKAVLGEESGVALEMVDHQTDIEGGGESDDDENVGEGEEETAPPQEVAGQDVCFACSTCGHQADTAATQALLDAEDSLCVQPPESPEELTALLGAGMFHQQHYMCFWLIDDIAMTLALDGQEVNPRSKDSKNKIRTSIGLVSQLLALLTSNPGVSSPHPEEVIFLDRLAQLHVMAGDTALAKQQYRAAFAKSCVCAGDTAASTLELKLLADNTPTSPEALMVSACMHAHTHTYTHLYYASMYDMFTVSLL